MSNQGIVINKTQATITIVSTGLAFGLVTKYALKKSNITSIIIGILGLGAGFIIDTKIQK